MRRLTRDDSGIASIFVILIMVVLLGATAIALDGGAVIVGKRSVQNSADAAALAAATDCGRGAACPPSVTSYLRTGETTPGAAINSGAHTATVTVSKVINFTFAPVIGMDSGTVNRSATAQWGTIGGASTIPIIISQCEFDQALLNGTTDVILYMGDPSPHRGCTGSPPGGFAWLTQSGCSVPTTAGGQVAGSTGASSHGGESCVFPLLGKEVLIPMFSGYSGTGSNATYTIAGYAAFKLTGYSFNGNDYSGLPKKCPDDTTRGTYCIQGDFVRFTTQQGTPGGSTDFGAYFVNLIR
jgi:hypothetical protein